METHICPTRGKRENSFGGWGKNLFSPFLRNVVFHLTTRNPSVVQFVYMSGYVYYLRPNSPESRMRNTDATRVTAVLGRGGLFVYLLVCVFVFESLKDELHLMLFS